MPQLWYALRSKPRKEDIVWRQLRSEGFEVFYPRIRVNPVNPRSRKIKPYFPGYMFVSIDLEQTGVSRFQWMPHTLGLVSFGGEPSHVPDNLIIELRKRVTEIAEAGGELFDGLKPGDAVHISSGPFQGYEAIFDTRLPGSERVRVLLELLTNKRRVPIELSSSSIEKKKHK
ncbi:MAG: putative RfaH family transcriptional regulator [Chloroflexi bacterium]|jgi:transcription antitermination factor NusG|nr:putative RfaH family transcriptional regulator [Chloroflexota bacterium]